MRILVVGGGGREHAIVWKLAQSPKATQLFCAPGNGGIAQLATCVPVKAMDFDGIVAFAREQAIDLTFVAPDDPLAGGLVDALEAAGCPAFGPSRAAARIEGSKSFAKALMLKYGIPTAQAATFDAMAAAQEYIRAQACPLVVKADGLALGKGVIVCDTAQQALDAVAEIMERKTFGEAGRRVVIEERMSGPEVSLMAFTDGKTVKLMPPAQDHKRAFDHDQGPNTGGMGAFAPTPTLNAEQIAQVGERVLQRAVDAMAAEGYPFRGILYAGLMVTPAGVRVVEFNARFGDPETQAVMPLLETDLLDIIVAIRQGTLDTVDIRWRAGAAAAIVLASGGYPGSYSTGLPINGLRQAGDAGALLFHSGTGMAGDRIVTAGGRVLSVAATAATLGEAIARAYGAAELVRFDHCHYRRDIGRT